MAPSLKSRGMAPSLESQWNGTIPIKQGNDLLFRNLEECHPLWRLWKGRRKLNPTQELAVCHPGLPRRGGEYHLFLRTTLLFLLKSWDCKYLCLNDPSDLSVVPSINHVLVQESLCVLKLQAKCFISTREPFTFR